MWYFAQLNYWSEFLHMACKKGPFWSVKSIFLEVISLWANQSCLLIWLCKNLIQFKMADTLCCSTLPYICILKLVSLNHYNLLMSVVSTFIFFLIWCIFSHQSVWFLFSVCLVLLIFGVLLLFPLSTFEFDLHEEHYATY